jgi:hypothetical protein
VVELRPVVLMEGDLVGVERLRAARAMLIFLTTGLTDR